LSNDRETLNHRRPRVLKSGIQWLRIKSVTRF